MALVMVMGLSGCQLPEEQEDLRHWVQQERKRARPRIEPLSEPSVFTPQLYVFEGEREPFDRLKLTRLLHHAIKQETGGLSLLQAEQNRPRQELEDYPLDAIAMVGFLDQKQQQTALVRVNKLIYQVTPGLYMGQNYGRIQAITETTIELREIVQDPAGDWIEKMTVLELQEGRQ
ncbi:MAG: pilus assembly protein PilP [Comamonas sp.]|nr:pilus assembly protein PilP [Comamonas sp.]